MPVRNSITATILLMMICCYAHAQDQQIKFIQVDGNNGEPLGQINSITQDTLGYMWFSGQGKNCLYRYDGVRMTAFRNDSLDKNSLGGTRLETVYADSRGNIWIGFLFGAGMDQYDPAKGLFTHYTNDPKDPASLSPGWISAILRDHLGRLWVGTQNGLDLLDEKTGKFIHYRNDPANPASLSDNFVRAIYEDHQGVLWIGTGYEFDNTISGNGGLNRMEKNGTFTRFLHDPGNPNSLFSNRVRSIFEDSRGIFWVGTLGNGLHTMDREKGIFKRYLYNPARPEQLSRPPLKDSGANDPITFITEDAQGAIWMGTYASGLNRYDTGTKKITHYESSNGFPDKNCWAACKSRDGVLWLSSTDLGSFLYRVVPSINKIPSITTSGFPSWVQEDKQGRIWASCWGVGLQEYDQNKKLVNQYRYQANDSINFLNSPVSLLFQNQKDTLWFCTSTGIILFNKITRQFTRLRYKTKLNSPQKIFSESRVYKIIQDKNGIKWFATSKGLFQYDQEKESINAFVPGGIDTANPKGKIIRDIIEDSVGIILAASEDGIRRLNTFTGQYTHYLPGISINHLYRDSEGTVWAVTNWNVNSWYNIVDLYRFSREKNGFVAFYYSQPGLGSKNVVNIIEDDQKNMWIITESDIVRLNAAKTDSYVYGAKYGIRAKTLRFGAICKTSKGEILVGNINGFYTFFPGNMADTSKALQINITDFFINNHRVSPGKESVLTDPIEETHQVSLKYNQDNFSFNFAAIDYRSPEANRYYTMLENYDSTWREAGADKNAFYLNIPPGKYVFRIKGVNVDGVQAEKMILVIIDPPWWKTWWAYAIYGLLLLIIIVGVHRFQQQRTIHKERQKAQVTELAQAKEIEKAYHELRATQSQLIQSEKMASLGELTAGIAHEIQNPLNFVNNFSEVNRELIDETSQAIKSGDQDEAIKLLSALKDNEEKIIHHGRRADAIVKGMLQHSRSSTGVKELTDINALADEYLRLAFHGIRAKDNSFNAAMKTDFDNSIGKINIIPQDMGRVLLNLYNNAFYAVNEKSSFSKASSLPGASLDKYNPTVSVSTKKTGNKITIIVADNGNGIPQKVVDKIFQPFFTTKPTGQGTGLGLSLSYDIVKAHGGELTVNKSDGALTEFVVQLPV